MRVFGRVLEVFLAIPSPGNAHFGLIPRVLYAYGGISRSSGTELFAASMPVSSISGALARRYCPVPSHEVFCNNHFSLLPRVLLLYKRHFFPPSPGTKRLVLFLGFST